MSFHSPSTTNVLACSVLDRTIGQEMNRIFVDDLQHGKEITAEALRRRSWLQRIVEWGANSLTRLL